MCRCTGRTACWGIANDLSVGQVCLLDNPLLRCPLAHVQPRLLGHWGTTPGLNFLYVHLDRVIRAQDLDMIFVAGPSDGAIGVVANTCLKGTYNELCPEVSRDAPRDAQTSWVARPQARTGRVHAFGYACEKHGIEHRLTRTYHPCTNGQVERMNRTLKDATVCRYHYASHDDLCGHVQLFLDPTTMPAASRRCAASHPTSSPVRPGPKNRIGSALIRHTTP